MLDAIENGKSESFFKDNGCWGEEDSLFCVSPNIFNALAVDPLHRLDLGVVG